MIVICFSKTRLCRPKHVLQGLFFGTLLMFFGAVALASPTKADSQIKTAEIVINNMVRDLEAHLTSSANNIEQSKNIITRILDNYFDMPNIVRFSVGTYWHAATEDERRVFSDSFRTVLIGTVLRNFDQLIGLKFDRTDSQTKGDKMVLVRGNFRDVKGIRPPIAVGWRISTPGDGTARILDIEIENISMLVTQKQENIAIIRKSAGRFGALIEAMQTQIGK